MNKEIGIWKFAAGVIVGMAIANAGYAFLLNQPQMWVSNLSAVAFAAWVFRRKAAE